MSHVYLIWMVGVALGLALLIAA